MESSEATRCRSLNVRPHGKVTVDIDTKVADVLYRGTDDTTITSYLAKY